MEWGSWDYTREDDLWGGNFNFAFFIDYNTKLYYRPRPKGFNGIHVLGIFIRARVLLGNKIYYFQLGKDGYIDYGRNSDLLESNLFTRVSPGLYTRNKNIYQATS